MAKSTSKKPKEAKRTIYYVRPHWFGNPDRSHSLEQILRKALKTLNTTVLREFEYSDHTLQGSFFQDDPTTDGLYFYVNRYTDGMDMTVVPHAKDNEINNRVDTVEPPEGHNFRTGGILGLLSGDNLVVCGDNLRWVTIAKYFDRLLINSNQAEFSGTFTLGPIGDVNKLALIQKTGATSIDLGLNIFDSSLDRISEGVNQQLSPLKKALKSIRDLVMDSSSEKLKELAKDENLSAKVTFGMDGRMKGGSTSRDQLKSFAERILREEETEDFSIISGSGERITSDEVKIHCKAMLPLRGDSVDRKSTWQKLTNYYVELKNKGVLEQ